ncbi:PAS domain S-box protein [Acidipila sp. EB88]|uniref:PAS domain-containing sensor histidine kinase n=1 Tax=Acidipila sp. EB88 TaxID=2305226 RepID=UPI000F5D5848|nr:PAS domain S-box protein [Acidipila sp. EB88]RRA48235.1 PAS domain S-box protein [Acidipila sp. EB88]
MCLAVRVFAPTGRDAELIVKLLRQGSLHAEACSDLPALLASLGPDPVGPLLIAEEALTPAFARQLAELIAIQPAWSDPPLLILTRPGREVSLPQSIQSLLAATSPVLLERPIRTANLISSVQAAVRARKRQYEVRDALLERDSALSELARERETLQAILDNLPVGIVLCDEHGRIILGNRSVEAIFRHPVIASESIEAHEDWIAFHPDGRRVRGEEYPLARVLKSGHALPPEDYLYQRGDGTRAWVRLAAAPILHSNSTVTGAVVAISDIDQQKRSEAALRRSESRFRTLIDNSSVGVLIGDMHGGISYMNPTLLSLLGYSRSDVENGQVRWSDLTPAGYADLDQHAIEQLEATGVAQPYEKEYRARDGHLIPLLLGATVIPTSADASQISGIALEAADGSSEASAQIAVFLTDLTTKKQAEAALIQSEKIAAVGRLAASISHEINNPLEAITNLLYIAQHSLAQPGHNLDLVRERLQQADQELARVSQIVTQTLQFHRQSTRPRCALPDVLVDSAIFLYTGRLANSHIELIRQQRGATPVLCYESDLRQVLNNLIGNAIDSMRTGGRLLLRTSRARLWRTGTPGIRITVADTGHGMPPDVLARIFEAFYTTKGNNGNGLGLWISLGIVEKHGGRLQVRSTTRLANAPGPSGTVFSLFIPADTVPEPQISTADLP